MCALMFFKYLISTVVFIFIIWKEYDAYPFKDILHIIKRVKWNYIPCWDIDYKKKLTFIQSWHFYTGPLIFYFIILPFILLPLNAKIPDTFRCPLKSFFFLSLSRPHCRHKFHLEFSFRLLLLDLPFCKTIVNCSISSQFFYSFHFNGICIHL